MKKEDTEKDTETKIRYLIVPDVVIMSDSINWGEKVIFGEIAGLSQKIGYCYASNKYFAKRFKIDSCTVSRWIGHLEKEGFIKRELIYKENSKEITERRIYINIENPKLKEFVLWYGKPCREGKGKNADSTPSKKVKDNNLGFNNKDLNSSKKRNYSTKHASEFDAVTDDDLTDLPFKE